MRVCLQCAYNFETSGCKKSRKLFTYRTLTFGVPDGTRTHDIQNHKQVVELPRTPVFIGISAFPLFAFAPILRRISAELYLNIISNLKTSSSLENAYPPPFLKERFSNLIAKIRISEQKSKCFLVFRTKVFSRQSLKDKK